MYVNYLKNEVSKDYCCMDCKVTGVKLWRESATSAPDVRCATCLEKLYAIKFNVDGLGYCYDAELFQRTDQLRSYVPAVPDTDGSFWGYTSVPQDGVDWWRGLPTRQSYITIIKRRFGKPLVHDALYPDWKDEL